MLKFVVDGKLLMEENDNGELNIIDEKLKESFGDEQDEQENDK